MSGMSSPPAGLGQRNSQHRRSPTAELCRVWWELCVRQHQARDRNCQLLQDFGHLETQLGLLWAKTDAVRRRKVDYEEFLQRLLRPRRMEAGSPGQVPQRQDWVSAWMLHQPLRSQPGSHLPNSPEWMDNLLYQTPWPNPVPSPRAQSPEPAAFLASTGAGGAGPMAGAHPQPTQPRVYAGVGSYTEEAISFGMGHQDQVANRASRRLLWRGAWEKDSMQTASEETWDRVPRLRHKEKLRRDTTPLDQGGSWGQESWGEQEGNDRPEETLGSVWCRLSVRGRESGRNRDPGEGVQLKGEVRHVLTRGAGQLKEGEGAGSDGCLAMGQIQEEEEEEEGLAGGQEVKKNAEGNRDEGSGGIREEAEGRGSKEGSALGQVEASAKGQEDEEGLVRRGGQEKRNKEESLAGAQGVKEEKNNSEREEGLVCGQEDNMEEEGLVKGSRGQTRAKEGETEEEVLAGWGTQEGGKEEEGQAGWRDQEQGDEEGSEEEEGQAGWGGQEQGDEEEGSEEEEGQAGWRGQEQGDEEEGSEEEEGQAGWRGQEQGDEEEGSEKGEEGSEEEEGQAGWSGQEQGDEEEGSEKGEEGSEEEESQAGWRGQEQSDEEQGLMQCEDQEQGKEEEGLAGCVSQEQGNEEGGSEQEGGLVGQQGGQERGEEDEGSERLAVRGAEGHVQEEEEEADSDLVLGPHGGQSNVELGGCRGGGRDSPAWNGCIRKAPHEGPDLGHDSAREEEEKEAESEADEAIEVALAPSGNSMEPRVKGRASECCELRRGSQGSPPLQEGSKKVGDQEFWSDQEEVGTDLETSLREDQSLDDQGDFYD